jgi:dGTPase
MRHRADRFHDDDLPADQRTPFQRDRDRILYTSAFRRLAGITQVIAPTERYPVHNRLTHTLEVAQVARRLAEKLQTDIAATTDLEAAAAIDADVAEAAALAHDLGHPPFGHIAEDELDKLAVSAGVLDGFNGNAQSFRIVTNLAVRSSSMPGLNLTRATLNGVLKYPWFRQASGTGRNKWGAYHTEQDEFLWVRPDTAQETTKRCTEAEIMDWADDIAYAVHDVEDFYRAGVIPLDRLATDDAERIRFLDASLERLGKPEDEQGLRDAFLEFATVLPVTEPYTGTRQQRAVLRSMASTLINRYIHACSCSGDHPDSLSIDISPRATVEIVILKQLTWHYVIDRASLATLQHGQRQMIRQLFNILAEEAQSTNTQSTLRYSIFPEYFRELLHEDLTDELRIRLVIDLIASMTERHIIDMYHRLTGLTQGSALERM